MVVPRPWRLEPWSEPMMRKMTCSSNESSKAWYRVQHVLWRRLMQPHLDLRQSTPSTLQMQMINRVPQNPDNSPYFHHEITICGVYNPYIHTYIYILYIYVCIYGIYIYHFHTYKNIQKNNCPRCAPQTTGPVVLELPLVRCPGWSWESTEFRVDTGVDLV